MFPPFGRRPLPFIAPPPEEETAAFIQAVAPQAPSPLSVFLPPPPLEVLQPTPAGAPVVSKEELNRQVALLLQRKLPELGIGEPGRPVVSPGIRRGFTVTDPPGVVVEELEGREALIRRDPATREPAPADVQLQQPGSARDALLSGLLRLVRPR